MRYDTSKDYRYSTVKIRKIAQKQYHSSYDETFH